MAEDVLHDKRVAPSILAGDYSRLGAQLEEVMAAGARVIHVDVMDGHFVPPITTGALVVDSISEQVHEAGGWLDVHLMVDRPERHVEDFAKAGSDSISVHWEATPHVHFALNAVREADCLAGLAINPATPPQVVDGLGDMFDLLLCMTVDPGWGGQSYIESSTDKVRALKGILPEGTPLEVDGGINAETAVPSAEAGATLFVAGSSVLGQEDPAEAYRRIAEATGAV